MFGFNMSIIVFAFPLAQEWVQFSIKYYIPIHMCFLSCAVADDSVLYQTLKKPLVSTDTAVVILDD